jgi:hypothetical protein
MSVKPIAIVLTVTAALKPEVADSAGTLAPQALSRLMVGTALSAER